jgi:membrane protein DedA with SNARE-associated domain
VAKFVPGLNFAAPPLAGILGVSSLRSLIFDSFASILWAGGYMSLGYLFSGRFERVAAYSTQLGAIPVVAVIAATAAGFKLLAAMGRWFRVEQRKHRRQNARNVNPRRLARREHA